MNPIKANQQRGSWIARLENGFSELGVDQADPYVAVIIVDENGQINWKSQLYTHYVSVEVGPWWLLHSSSRWKELLASGKPILLRKGLNPDTKTAGPKIGLFQIEDVVFTENHFQFRIMKRLGECS